jgi:hypothetical protein
MSKSETTNLLQLLKWYLYENLIIFYLDLHLHLYFIYLYLNVVLTFEILRIEYKPTVFEERNSKLCFTLTTNMWISFGYDYPTQLRFTCANNPGSHDTRSLPVSTVFILVPYWQNNLYSFPAFPSLGTHLQGWCSLYQVFVLHGPLNTTLTLSLNCNIRQSSQAMFAPKEATCYVTKMIYYMIQNVCSYFYATAHLRIGPRGTES